MTGTATNSPETQTEAQTQPLRERVCRECEVRSYFAHGFEADWSGWEGRLCPRCSREAALEAAKEADREEQEKLIIEVLRRGIGNITDISRQTGIPVSVVRPIKQKALAEGLIGPASPKPKRMTKEERAAAIHE